MRPVCKATDRSTIREIFRKEFFGSILQTYPDEGLWEIYDSMITNDRDLYGAYLVSYRDRLLFLLEIHPPDQMDLPVSCLAEPGSVGVFCFFASPEDHMNLPAIRTCMGALLDAPSIHRILTIVSPTSSRDPRFDLLKKAGFRRLPESPDRSNIYSCSMDSFQLLPEKAERLSFAVY